MIHELKEFVLPFSLARTGKMLLEWHEHSKLERCTICPFHSSSRKGGPSAGEVGHNAGHAEVLASRCDWQGHVLNWLE